MRTTIFQYLQQISNSISIETVSILAMIGYVIAIILVMIFR